MVLGPRDRSAVREPAIRAGGVASHRKARTAEHPARHDEIIRFGRADATGAQRSCYTYRSGLPRQRCRIAAQRARRNPTPGPSPDRLQLPGRPRPPNRVRNVDMIDRSARFGVWPLSRRGAVNRILAAAGRGTHGLRVLRLVLELPRVPPLRMPSAGRRIGRRQSDSSFPG
jgi:hypothetical protein